jgi:MFS family permease
MTRYTRLLLITFLATAAEIVTTRAVFFFVTNRFQFEQSQNLGIALGFSTVGALGALFSHRIARMIGNRTTLLASMAINLFCDAAVIVHPAPAFIVAGTIIKGGCVLTMWPIVEAYVTAGLSPRQTASALGGFNIAWTAAIPIMLAISGALIDHTKMGVFLVPMALQVVVLYLFTTLEADPVQLPDDHPSALPQSHERHYANMLRSSRFTVLSMNAGLAFVNPLLPTLLQNLHYSATQATAIAAIMDVARVAAIIAMFFIPWWHGRRSFLLIIILAVPVSLLFLLKGGSITALVIGEVIFGFAGGAAYFAGIYYSMVLHRSGEGGAMHEMLGQVGSVLGPGAGLVGDQLVKNVEPVGRAFERVGIRISGPLLGLSPVLAFLTVAALFPLRHKRPAEASPPEPPEPDPPLAA